MVRWDFELKNVPWANISLAECWSCWSKEARCGWACSQCCGSRDSWKLGCGQNLKLFPNSHSVQTSCPLTLDRKKNFLQNCTAFRLEILWPKAVQKTICLISQIAWIQEMQDNGRSSGCSKKAQTWKCRKRMSGGFKLISCTAADDKFLFRTSKCSRKNWNHCVFSAFEISTRCQSLKSLFCIRNLNALLGRLEIKLKTCRQLA